MTTAVAPTSSKLEATSSNATDGPPYCTVILQPGTEALSVSPSDFLASRPDIHNVLAGCMVFRPTLASVRDSWVYETLLLRRSASDSYPLKWEVPAGTADPELDPTIISTAVRELWEETGLRAQCIICPITLGIAGNAGVWIDEEGRDARMDPELSVCLVPSAGKTWAVVTFLVMAEPGSEWNEVELRPEEHSEYAWVTEEEVRTSRMKSKNGAPFDFVSEAMRLTIIEGFRMKKLIGEMVEAARSAKRAASSAVDPE
jgi:8-oxo-dGTP pyrophosphatase MutT (NUDIX family)